MDPQIAHCFHDRARVKHKLIISIGSGLCSVLHNTIATRFHCTCFGHGVIIETTSYSMQVRCHSLVINVFNAFPEVLTFSNCKFSANKCQI